MPTLAPRARNIAPRLAAVFAAMKTLQDAIEEFVDDETAATVETIAALTMTHGRHFDAEDLDEFACETIEHLNGTKWMLSNVVNQIRADYRGWKPFADMFGDS